MEDQSMQLFQDLMTAIFTTAGDSSSSLRTNVAQQAVRVHTASTLDEGSIPPELETFVKKVALHAYRVTDQDIEQLRAHGYSDDAIFEITLSIASSVSQNCLTQGMKALEGAKNEIAAH